MEDLSCFVPHVLKQVEVVLNKRHIGIDPENVVMKNPETSCNSYDKNGNCDRFTLVVPYAGASVECIVIFQTTDPECPPDFMFMDPKFFFPIVEIETLRQWDALRSDGLYRALKEIMPFYRKKNIEELGNYSVLYYEYLSLYEIKSFNEDDIEIYVPVNPDLPVTFFIRLHVEFCAILPDVSQRNEVDYALLIVTFPDRQSERCGFRFHFSREIKKVLNSNGNMDFLYKIAEIKLNRYKVTAEEKLRCQVDFIASRIKKKSTTLNCPTDESPMIIEGGSESHSSDTARCSEDRECIS